MEKGAEEGSQQDGLTSFVRSRIGLLWSAPDWQEIGIDSVIWYTESRRVVVTVSLRRATRVTDDDDDYYLI